MSKILKTFEWKSSASKAMRRNKEIETARKYYALIQNLSLANNIRVFQSALRCFWAIEDIARGDFSILDETGKRSSFEMQKEFTCLLKKIAENDRKLKYPALSL